MDFPYAVQFSCVYFSCISVLNMNKERSQLMMIWVNLWGPLKSTFQNHISKFVARTKPLPLSSFLPKYKTRARSHMDGVDKWSAIPLQMTTDLFLISLFNLLLLLGGKLCEANGLFVFVFSAWFPHIKTETCCCCPPFGWEWQEKFAQLDRVRARFDYAAVIRKQCAKQKLPTTKGEKMNVSMT